MQRSRASSSATSAATGSSSSGGPAAPGAAVGVMVAGLRRRRRRRPSPVRAPRTATSAQDRSGDHPHPQAHGAERSQDRRRDRGPARRRSRNVVATAATPVGRMSRPARPAQRRRSARRTSGAGASRGIRAGIAEVATSAGEAEDRSVRLHEVPDLLPELGATKPHRLRRQPAIEYRSYRSRRPRGRAQPARPRRRARGRARHRAAFEERRRQARLDEAGTAEARQDGRAGSSNSTASSRMPPCTTPAACRRVDGRGERREDRDDLAGSGRSVRRAAGRGCRRRGGRGRGRAARTARWSRRAARPCARRRRGRAPRSRWRWRVVDSGSVVLERDAGVGVRLGVEPAEKHLGARPLAELAHDPVAAERVHARSDLPSAARHRVQHGARCDSPARKAVWRTGAPRIGTWSTSSSRG